jgi:hypothetical protein
LTVMKGDGFYGKCFNLCMGRFDICYVILLLKRHFGRGREGKVQLKEVDGLVIVR